MQTACPNTNRRGLVIQDADEKQDVYDSQDEEDQADNSNVYPTTADSGHLLILHRSFLAPRQQDDKWLRTNIFRSTCTIKDRICSFISRNVISEEAVTKLGILRKPHPAPYSLG